MAELVYKRTNEAELVYNEALGPSDLRKGHKDTKKNVSPKNVFTTYYAEGTLNLKINVLELSFIPGHSSHDAIVFGLLRL